MDAVQTKANHLPVIDLCDWAEHVSLQRRFARLWMGAVLVLMDLASLALAFLLAVWLRGVLNPGFTAHAYYSYLPAILLFPFVFFWRGLYPGIGLGAVEELRRLTINASLMFLSIAAFTFIVKAPQTFSRLAFGLTWLFALALLPFGRAAARYLCTRLRLWGEPVVLVGPVDHVVDLLHTLKQYPKIGLNPVAVIHPGEEPLALPPAALDGTPVFAFGAVEASCQRAFIRTALVVYRDVGDIDFYRDAYKDTFERVVFTDGRAHDFRFAGVTIRQYGDRAGLEVNHSLLDPLAQLQKRLIDIVVSALAITVLSPFLALVVALIRLDSKGSPFYFQPRIGKGGRIFYMLKFRTMHLNADAVLQEHLQRDPALRAEWDRYQKLHNDPRITRVGRFLRRFSIDELPQLWNVLAGHMSLVGPRPIMVSQRDRYGSRFAQYIRVTPGITGKWQISGRNHTTFARRAELDEQYVMDWSVWLDLYILIRTFWVVLIRDGAC